MSTLAGDPRPQAPLEPAPESCCNGGCAPCVFDRYSEALERYREARQAWMERHPGSGSELLTGSTGK